MTLFYRDKSIESAKFLSGILVYGVIGKWKFLPQGYWGGELVKIIADTVASFVVVFLVSDLFMGRPTLHLEWRRGVHDRPPSGEVVVSGKIGKEILNLQIKASGETALQKYLLRRSMKKRFKVEIRMVPEGSVRLSRQSGTRHFSCGADKETLIFDWVQVDGKNLIASADFTLKKMGSSAQAHKVGMRLSACWEPRICRLPVKLVKLQSSVEQFVLEGTIDGDTNRR